MYLISKFVLKASNKLQSLHLNSSVVASSTWARIPAFRDFRIRDPRYFVIQFQTLISWIPHHFMIFKKKNVNKLTWGIIVAKSNFFVRFLEESRIPKSPFDINWPLVYYILTLAKLTTSFTLMTTAKLSRGDKFQAEIISTCKMSQGQWMKSFQPDSQSCN